jgi:tetratricopeptide (TPR) repeat protein
MQFGYDYDKAVPHLRRAAFSDKNDVRSALLLGDALLTGTPIDESAIAEVIPLLERIAERPPKTAAAYGVLGRLHAALGDERAAEQNWRAAIDVGNAPGWIYSRLGEYARRRAEYDTALALLDQAVFLGDDSAETRATRAQIHVGLGNQEAAIGDFAAALRLDPTLDWVFEEAKRSAESGEAGPLLSALADAGNDKQLPRLARSQALHKAALLLLDRADYRQALVMLNRAIHLDSSSITVRLLRARVHWQQGAQKKADIDVAEVERLDPSLNWVLDEPTIVAAVNPAMADRLIARLLRYADDSPPSSATIAKLQSSAHALVEAGAYKSAAMLLEHATDLAPNAVGVWGSYGEALRLAGRGEDALSAFNVALGETPNDPWLLASRGATLWAGGDPNGGASDLVKAVELRGGQYPFASLTLAALLSEQGEVDEARMRLQEVLEHDPQNLDAHRGLASLLSAAGHHAEALAALTRVPSGNLEDPSLRSDVAVLTARLEDYERALQIAQETVRDNPKSVDALITLGTLHAQFGEWPVALGMLERAAALDEYRGDVHALRGFVLEYQGSLSEARDAIDAALQFDSDPMYRKELGIILWKLGDASAEEHLRGALKLARQRKRPSAVSAAIEGSCLLLLGAGEEATQRLAQSLELDRLRLDVQFDLALALMATGHRVAGSAEYRRATARVRKRWPRRQLGLLGVALTDLCILERLRPDVSGAEECRALLERSLAEARADAEELDRSASQVKGLDQEGS